MRVQLAQQAQDLLGQSDLVIITERVDDVALLIGQMVKMGFVEVLDRHLPRHWKQRGLSWGWTGVIWLAYIRFCRKVRFLGQNPKIGYQKFNDLQTAKLSKKQLCDRTQFLAPL